VLTTMLWGCAVLAMVSAIGAGLLRRGRGQPAAVDAPGEAGVEDVDLARSMTVLADAPPFSLLDQDGKTVTLETLKGKPWVADFVFTRCAGPCPMMTAKMSKLSKALGEGETRADVRFVSVSVDPGNDTPAVLKEYADKFKADTSRWSFLTGEPDAVYAFAKRMLVTALPASEDKPIIHSEKFVLVDGAGKIRGFYSSNDEGEVAQLESHARQLAAAAQP
jgi:cytochrome oxidase Cu insertion factor (SCO1/SenC/PrrC family)